MNPFDSSLFTAPSCLPCCTPAPADCPCALLIPPFASPYADYATAAAAIADQVSGCLGYFLLGGDGGAGNSISAAFDGTTISADQDSAFSGGIPSLSNTTYISVSALSSAVLSCVYTTSTDGTPITVSVDLLDCSDGSSVDSDSSASGSGTLTVTVPADGEYVLYFQIMTDEPTYLNSTWDVTSSSAFWVNPVIALWDDSGTTRQLEACPKMLLPLHTESSGDWFADCAAAADEITDFVDNCIGYCPYDAGSWVTVGAFSSTGGSTLTLAATGWKKTNTGATPGMSGSINAEVGETISFAWTTSTAPGTLGDPGASVSLYDDTGTLVYSDSETAAGGTGTMTSGALPYTGRYFVVVNGNGAAGPGPGDPNTVSSTIVITSSGTMSVNPIQARYDLSLTCSGNLDCGDSCP